MATTEGETLVALTLQAAVLQDGDVLMQAHGLEIDGPETAELAVELREGISALLSEIDAGYRPHIARAHELHKGLCAELRERSAAPTQALQVVNHKLATYELARRQAEEAARREAEAQAEREALARREAEAQAAAVYGPAAAESVRSQSLDDYRAPVTSSPLVAAKTRGVAVTVAYEAQVTDLAALAAFALANPALLALVLAPNQAGLDTLVKQQGEAFSVPGVARVPKAPVVRGTRR